MGEPTIGVRTMGDRNLHLADQLVPSARYW